MAKSLGITANVLYKWKEKVEAELEGKVLIENEPAELKHLRKEVKELRMEKEILQGALG